MASIKHIFTNPRADGADPTIVRPSDWNSAHAITMIEGVSLSGNTDGVLANITSGTFYLAGGANITLSQNANSVTVVGGAGGANTGYLSAGTQTGSLGTVSFADSNGVSFGMSNQTITATVKTDYLTTAMASDQGSNFVQANAAFAGTNASGTINSTGISVSVQAPAGATVNVSAGTTSGNLTQVVFSNSNDIDFGLNGSTVTAQYSGLEDPGLPSPPSDFIFAGSNITISESPTADAISIFAPDTTQFLTTAMASDAGSRFVNTSAGLNLTSISATFNSNSISLSVGPYITTAMASDAGSRFVNTSAGLNLTSISATFNSNSISLSVGPYITTAMASDAGSRFVNTSAGLNLTSISATFNSNSISLSVGPYITTAMVSDAGTRFVQANATIAGTNISGTIASNVISLSVAAPGGGGSATFSAGTSSAGLASLVFSDSNGLAFGLNGSTITADHSLGDWQEQDWMPSDYIFGSNLTITEATNTDAQNYAITISAPATSSLVGTSGISVSSNGSTISIYQPVVSEFEPFKEAPITNSTLGQSTLYFVPFDVNDMLSASRVNFFHSIAFTYSGAPNNSTAWLAAGYGLYTRMTGTGSDRISLLTSYSMSYLSGSVSSSTRLSMTNYWQLSNGTSHSTTQFGVNNATAGTYLTSSIGGYRVLAYPVSQLLTPGRYWMGYSVQSASQGASFILGHSVAQAQFSNQLAWRPFNVTSQASDASFWQASAGAGVYSAASAAWPNSIPLTSDSIRALTAMTIPIFNFSGISQSSNVI